MKSLLRTAAQLLFVIAAVALFAGGRLITTLRGTERARAEMAGIGMAVLCAGLGAWAKSGAGHFEDKK
jgi:hypothetical protein